MPQFPWFEENVMCDYIRYIFTLSLAAYVNIQEMQFYKNNKQSQTYLA